MKKFSFISSVLLENKNVMSEYEFNQRIINEFIGEEMENNGWKSPKTIHHGTTSTEAEKIIELGFFKSGKDYVSFFTTSKKEAENYAQMRTMAERHLNKEVRPHVFSLTVDPWAVTVNHGSGEIETHPLIPLHIAGNRGYVSNDDIVKSQAFFKKGNSEYDYQAYLASTSE